MVVTSIVTGIVAVAKAIPAAERILDMVVTEWIKALNNADKKRIQRFKDMSKAHAALLNHAQTDQEMIDAFNDIHPN